MFNPEPLERHIKQLAVKVATQTVLVGRQLLLAPLATHLPLHVLLGREPLVELLLAVLEPPKLASQRSIKQLAEQYTEDRLSTKPHTPASLNAQHPSHVRSDFLTTHVLYRAEFEIRSRALQNTRPASRPPVVALVQRSPALDAIVEALLGAGLELVVP